MSVLALASVTGAPGVTTTAVALAVCWPRQVILVEADPNGASAVLPGYCRGHARHDHGVLDAAVAARAGTLAADLPGLLIDLPGSTARLLAALTRPEQAATMDGAWPVLAPALVDAAHQAGTDLILDLGRLSQHGAPRPVLALADRVLLLTATTLPALHAVRAWLPTIRADLVDPTRLALLLTGEGQPYRAGEIAKHLGTAVAGVLPADPAAAAPWSAGTAHPRRSDHARAVAGLIADLTQTPANQTPAPRAAGGR